MFRAIDVKAAIVGLGGPDLLPEEAALLRADPPAGVILFSRNIEGPQTLARLTGQLRAMLPDDAVLLVDQEGGRVARLRPPDWRAHPAAASIGQRYQRDGAAGLRLAWLTGALIGLDCAEAGFDVTCAPVLDVQATGTTDAIGDRSYGPDPDAVAALGRSMADGLLSAGIQPVGKHVPGHGRTSVDSHLGLPWIDPHTDLAADIDVFTRLNTLPWMMTAHVLYAGLNAERPATLSPHIIGQVIRGAIGFDGVLVSDDLAMGALTGPPGARAAQAIAAGCDLALHCSGRLHDIEAVLAASPAVSPEAATRLARARATAGRHRIPLDRPALIAEQEALLA